MNNLFINNKKYLYLITPPNLLTKRLLLKNFLIILEKVLKTKKVKYLQLRLKNKKKNQVLNCLKKINFLCKKYKTICFINDYTDNKILNFCDGVHLGQKDLSKNKIKKILLQKKYLGITCHNSENFAKKALKYNPTYILFYGWSKIIDNKIINDFECIMLHPSPLPKYRGGSPIQNQIINGDLEAPQAFLMASITNGILGGGMDWAMVFMGTGIAFCLIALRHPDDYMNILGGAYVLFLGVLVWAIPKQLIYADASDQAKWRDIRVWATALIVFQVALYMMFA